jgi:predicted lipoprotein
MIARTAWAALIAALAVVLASCAPWTVRPLESGRETSSGSSAVVSPAAYVDAVWASKLLPAINNSAVDVRGLLNAIVASTSEAQTRYGHRDANGPCFFVVKGEGVVTAVDTKSRVGLALVDTAPYDNRPDVSIQIGPVIRGTALRDATGIVRFTDFTNQLQFADVGNEINNRVLRTVLAQVDRDKLKGKKVYFVGAMASQENSEPPLRDLVPITLTVEEDR